MTPDNKAAPDLEAVIERVRRLGLSLDLYSRLPGASLVSSSDAAILATDLRALLDHIAQLEAGRGAGDLPDDPTPAMIEAGLSVDFDNEDERGTVINIWHVMRAALSNSPAREAWNPTHRHVKRGTAYEVIDQADLQTETPLADYAVLTVYKGEDGRLWARPTAEFNDGRFERLAHPPAQQDREGAGGLLPEPREVECVSYESGFRQPAPSVWYLEVGGYVAEFPTETAARNFRSAILAALQQPEPAPVAWAYEAQIDGVWEPFLRSYPPTNQERETTDFRNVVALVPAGGGS